MSNAYFYIIRHKPTGLMYAGSSAGNRYPHTKFMTERGYKTSSKEVHALIARDGLEAFEIVDLILNAEINVPFGMPAVEYETWFLRNHDCAASPLWLNKHNNDRQNFASESYTAKVKQLMLVRYGVENAMHMPEVIAKFSETMKGNKYGCKPRSAETRAKMSAYQKGRPKSEAHRAAVSAGKLGKKASAEAKAKMSATRTGKPRPESWHIKMAEYRERQRQAKLNA